MRLLAISDLHLGHAVNREALAALPAHPDDWLIVAGDVGESVQHLVYALRLLLPRFRQLVWVPGNHDLWTPSEDPEAPRGEQKYRLLVEVCRSLGVITPEDPYPLWKGEGGPAILAPLFTLYDYSFRPPAVPFTSAVEWAVESGVLCADERYLSPRPYASLPHWCEARCEWTEGRLEAVAGGHPLVLIDHYPLREELVFLPRIPRFSIWCGSQRTADWPVRFGAAVVVSGHLHMRSTRHLEGVRYEEVSLGYPRQWRQENGMAGYLRQILPAPDEGGGL